MERSEFAVFIGRFQPIHNTHLEIIKQALAESGKLILVVGSARATPDTKNPFTFTERSDMIRACLSPDENARTVMVPVRDYFYNDNLWLTEIQQAVCNIAGDNPSVVLYGSYKDASSYYVQAFPQWEFRSLDVRSTDNATNVRAQFFEDPDPKPGWDDHKAGPWHQNVPREAADWIRAAMPLMADRLARLRADYSYFKQYREAWKDCPFPPFFVTADAVVTMSGHVIVVRRGRTPGKGLLALPGGFVRADERVEDAVIRELREETRIKIQREDLRRFIVGQQVFDYPVRSARGRVVTHAYHIDLGMGELPEIKGGDDAAGAIWIPLADAIKQEDEFFEDHWQILNAMVTGYRGVQQVSMPAARRSAMVRPIK
jgi:bifunctional NMN adenylyltransferase/nudix hydrolase